jgi:glycosyltransferase involved in cell wall biosynthesis
MKKISILVRVYDRLEDLEICLKLIRENWKINDYEVIVISNGKTKGYTWIFQNQC